MLLLYFGCSLGTYDYTPCDADAQCRKAFGLGSMCGEQGLCVAVPENNRCSTVFPEDLLSNPEAHKSDLLVGALLSLDQADGDIEENLAVQLAVSQVNDQGGLDGRPYALVTCDYTESTAIDNLTATEAVQSGADYLAKMGVPFAVGPATSSMSQDVFPVVEDAGILLISPSATSPALTNIDGISHSDADPGLFWRTAPPDDLQGLAIARDMADRNDTTVAVIYETSVYGAALAEVFKSYFEGSGGRTAELFPYEEGQESTRDNQVVTVAQGQYDEVLFISGEVSDYVGFLLAAKALPFYEDKALFFSDAARDTSILEGASGASALFPNIRGSAPAVPAGVLYDLFKAAFESSNAPYLADASSYTAYSYDAAWLGIYGTVWSQHREADDACGDDDDGICGLGAARGLRRVSSGEAQDIKPVSWNTIKASLTAGQAVDLEGSSGHLDFDTETEETTGPVDVWVVNGDASGFTTVDTIDPSGG